MSVALNAKNWMFEVKQLNYSNRTSIILSPDSFIISEIDIQSEGGGGGVRHVDYPTVIKGCKFPDTRQGGYPVLQFIK